MNQKHLQRLYQQVILDHNKHPRNFQAVEPCTHHAHGYNPLCGDDYELYLTIRDHKIEDAGFQGHGCAISKASASLMTDAIKGKTLEEALKLKDAFLEQVTHVSPSTDESVLGRLAALKGVREFPIRVKCATLIWRTLESAVAKSAPDIVSTE